MNISAKTRHSALVVALIASVVLCAQATPAAAVPPSAHAGEIVMEVLVLRPLGLARIVVGAPFFAIALPFVVFREEGVREAWNLFIDEPIENAFERRLGDF